MTKGIGFLLGAGASYELGLPLVDELTIEFKTTITRLWNSSYYKLPQKIEQILLPLFANESLNYEDIIGRIEVEIQRNHNKTLYQEWYGVLHRYLEVIYYLLFERHEKNQQYIKKRLHLLKPINKYCQDSPLWIFSLNHDLLIEMMAEYFSIPLESGFKDSIKLGGISFERLSRENMNNHQFNFIQNSNGINLIKIHGSLDIFVHGDEKNYLKIVHENNIIDKINFLKNNDPTLKKGVKVTNEITYNDDKNILQFLRMTIMSGKHKYSSRVSHNMDDWFFKIFQGHINYVTELYCIGLSFQDQHVSSVLYDWLSFSRERKMIIVNPYLKSIPNEFTHISDQIEIINKGFLEFLNQDEDSNKVKIKFNKTMRDFSRKQFIRKQVS